MKKTNENKLSMFYAVIETCLKFAATWTTFLPFKTAHDEFVDNLNSLKAAAQVQKQILKGVAVDKVLKREAMVKKATEVAQGIYAYAVDQGNEVLRGQMSVGKSTFYRQRDGVIAVMCQNVHDTGVAELANLGPYGLLAADMTSLQGLIDAYEAVISSPRTAVGVRKNATTEIDILVKDNMKILANRMDKLMPEFETSDPAFYNEYFNSRMIIDLGTGEKDTPALAA
ncbi:MAG: hypothetical protein KA175_14255 [Flavobacteriales bacterium]|nr:hypothetical protein [Flavobacteriales bacterium]MBP6698778.1 hypothetical protein [Flavobacteriales bacterium]